MLELSMHVLDIAQNSISAKATLIELSFIIDEQKDIFEFVIKDNGVGMDEETVEAIKSPFYTSRTTRKVGLGIPMLIETAKMTNGFVDIKSSPGKGTEIRSVFGLSNIDRPPLGDIAGTILTLVLADENVDIIVNFEKIGKEKFYLDTREIKNTLQGVSIYEPEVISFLKEYIIQGIESVKNGGVL